MTFPGIDQPSAELQAYPLSLNLAAKLVTAMRRREVSTRDRDFADIWVTSRLHRLDAAELRAHVLAVADHRGQPVMAMAHALVKMPDRQLTYPRSSGAPTVASTRKTWGGRGAGRSVTGARTRGAGRMP